MNEVNMAVLGFGFMGKVYAYAADSLKHFYPDCPKVNISSVLVSEKTDQAYLKNRYQFQNTTTDYSSILDNKLINAVYVLSIVLLNTF